MVVVIVAVPILIIHMVMVVVAVAVAILLLVPVSKVPSIYYYCAMHQIQGQHREQERRP